MGAEAQPCPHQRPLQGSPWSPASLRRDSPQASPSFLCSKNLTWRDMQHLVVQTSKPAHLNANDWATNGVGRKGEHRAGLGVAGALCASQLTPPSLPHSEPFVWLRVTGRRCHGGSGPELDDGDPPAEVHHRHPH